MSSLDDEPDLAYAESMLNLNPELVSLINRYAIGKVSLSSLPPFLQRRLYYTALMCYQTCPKLPRRVQDLVTFYKGLALSEGIVDRRDFANSLGLRNAEVEIDDHQKARAKTLYVQRTYEKVLSRIVVVDDREETLRMLIGNGITAVDTLAKGLQLVKKGMYLLTDFDGVIVPVKISQGMMDRVSGTKPFTLTAGLIQTHFGNERVLHERYSLLREIERRGVHLGIITMNMAERVEVQLEAIYTVGYAMSQNSIRAIRPIKYKGDQPFALDRRALDFIKRHSQDYVVAEKTDGERSILVITNSASTPRVTAVSYDRTKSLGIPLAGEPAGMNASYFVDTERVYDRHAQRWVYIAFDSSRKAGSSYNERLADLQQSIDSLRDSGVYHIELKKVYPVAEITEITKHIQIVDGEHVYNNVRQSLNDGLVFTPVNPKSDYKTYKYKFPDMHTVDLLARVESRMVVLYAGGDNVLVRVGQVGSVEEFVRSLDTNDKKEFAHRPTTIVECSLPLFHAVRLRLDKDKPNYIDIVRDNIRVAREELSLEEVITTLSSSQVGYTNIEWSRFTKLDKIMDIKLWAKNIAVAEAKLLKAGMPMPVIKKLITHACYAYTNDKIGAFSDAPNVRQDMALRALGAFEAIKEVYPQVNASEIGIIYSNKSVIPEAQGAEDIVTKYKAEVEDVMSRAGVKKPSPEWGTSRPAQRDLLRKYHNDIKRDLIRKYVKRGDVVVDLGAGKGGDLQKYQTVGISKLYAIEPNPAFIDELEKRYEGLGRPFELAIAEGYAQNPKIAQSIGRVANVASMFFSLTFFFVDVATLSYLAKNISEMLLPDGYFIGTVMDGAKVQRLFNQRQNKVTIGNVTIEKEQAISDPPFGQKITYMFEGSQTVAEKQVEYLVDMEELTRTLALYNFEKVEIAPFPASQMLSGSEQLLNSLYTTFVYKK